MLGSIPLVEVPLKKVQWGVKVEINELQGVLDNEYATKYLELMGVTPSREKVEFILRSLPTSDAYIHHLRAATDTLLIFPGMAKKKKECEQIISKLVSIEDKEPPAGKAKKAPTDISSKSANTLNNRSPDQPKKPRKVSWCSVNTLNLLNPIIDRIGIHNILSEEFKVLLRAPIVEEKILLNPVFRFCGSLVHWVPSIRKDKSGRLYNNINNMLASKRCLRLYGLVCHFLYWSIIHPTVRHAYQLALTEGDDTSIASSQPSYSPRLQLKVPIDDQDMAQYDGSTVACAQDVLSPADMEALFVQFEECLHDIQQRCGYSEVAISTSHQALIVCLHFTVDAALTKLYPWLDGENPSANADHVNGAYNHHDDDCEHQLPRIHAISNRDIHPDQFELAMEMKRLIHQVVADLLDPARLYTSTMLVRSFSNTNKPLQKASKARFFVTSLKTRAVFGDAMDSSTRKFLAMGHSPYVPIPGVASKKALHHGESISNQGLPIVNATVGSDDIPANGSGAQALTVDIPMSPIRTMPMSQSSPALIQSPPVDATAVDSSYFHNHQQNLMKSLRNIRQIKTRPDSINGLEDLAKSMMATNTSSIVVGDGVDGSGQLVPITFSRSPLNFHDLFNTGTQSSPQLETMHEKRRHIERMNSNNSDYKPVIAASSLASQSIGSGQSAGSRSLANNPKAEFPISLKAKTHLMGMLTEKVSARYTSKSSALSAIRNNFKPNIIRGLSDTEA